MPGIPAFSVFYSPRKDSRPQFYDVIIIGAGIAGLGAATYLKNKNKSFHIFEAQATAGGRINTTNLIDCKTKSSKTPGFVEAGAQWLHGKENVVFEIAKINELLSSEKSEEGCGAYIRRGDGFRFDEFFVEKVDFEVGKILMKCEEFVRDPSGVYPASVGRFLNENFERVILQKFEGDEVGARQLLDWHNRFQIIDNSCMDLGDVSAKLWGQYSFNGEDCQAHINFKRGFSRLVDVLVEELGAPRHISYSTAVEEIAWSASDGVRVRCQNGLEFLANHVIVTCSLGVLRERMHTMFKPRLPDQYADAIENIGFGTIDKIFLQFKTAWWEEMDMDGIQLVFEDANYEVIAIYDIKIIRY
jgi:spermine oxidase